MGKLGYQEKPRLDWKPLAGCGCLFLMVWAVAELLFLALVIWAVASFFDGPLWAQVLAVMAGWIIGHMAFRKG